MVEVELIDKSGIPTNTLFGFDWEFTTAYGKLFKESTNYIDELKRSILYLNVLIHGSCIFTRSISYIRDKFYSLTSAIENNEPFVYLYDTFEIHKIAKENNDAIWDAFKIVVVGTIGKYTTTIEVGGNHSGYSTYLRSNIKRGTKTVFEYNATNWNSIESLMTKYVMSVEEIDRLEQATTKLDCMLTLNKYIKDPLVIISPYSEHLRNRLYNHLFNLTKSGVIKSIKLDLNEDKEIILKLE